MSAGPKSWALQLEGQIAEKVSPGVQEGVTSDLRGSHDTVVSCKSSEESVSREGTIHGVRCYWWMKQTVV